MRDVYKRQVEDELQITIFERTPTGVTLTPQGERFAAQASGILKIGRAHV